MIDCRKRRLAHVSLLVVSLFLITAAVVSARAGSAGVSWSGIGEILGLSSDTSYRDQPLTLDAIFTAPAPPEVSDRQDTVILAATGDVIPARSVNSQSTAKNDFLWAERPIAGALSAADITFINLETPLIDGCPVVNDGMIFCGDPRHVSGLLSAGVDVVTLGNNHAGNYGADGIRQTASLLKTQGIAVTGDGQTAYVRKNGTVFAFVGFNDIGHEEQGLSWASPERIAQDISVARKHADVVVAAFHWGTEYVRMPTQRQERLAHMAVDAGAGLVIGNHPHWIQPAEIYHGGLIVYAHGNTVFDQMWSSETKRGVIGYYTFTGGRLVGAAFMPIGIRDWGQAFPLTGEARTDALNVMRDASYRLSAIR